MNPLSAAAGNVAGAYKTVSTVPEPVVRPDAEAVAKEEEGGVGGGVAAAFGEGESERLRLASALLEDDGLFDDDDRLALLSK